MTDNSFSTRDHELMLLALEQAENALNSGNYPVGAVLIVDNEIIGKAENEKDTNHDRISHAENMLYMAYSKEIKHAKNEGKVIELFTTFEPCLMCLGTAVIHRTDRIVVACPDPRGDISKINPAAIGVWYQRNWPRIEYGLEFEKSYELFMKAFEQHPTAEFQEARELFPSLRDRFSQP